MQQKAEELNIVNQIWFYGPCYDELINAEFIFNADLCIAPGNVGLTAIHSMMFGCPVITHDDFKHQMPEFEAIKPFYTGAFFKRDSQSSLNEVIMKWFNKNENNREYIRQQCYNEIDTKWTPKFQMNVIREIFK